MKNHWSLDPNVDFLNHGSFGACPRNVLDYQSRLRGELEAQPVRFMTQTYPRCLSAVRERVANWLGCGPGDLVFTSNATAGVNAVLQSLCRPVNGAYDLDQPGTFGPGDEVLTTNHTYAACANALSFVANMSGTRVVVAQVPFPIASADQVLDAVLAEVTPRTRLALLDHVTSITGLVFPIERLVAALKDKGVETLVDGAHAPGMVPLGLDALGAGFYAANFHKWVCAPKGAALLWVRPDLQPRILPTVISHGYTAPLTERFQRTFDWTGTEDPTARLCVAEAIDYMEGLVPGGWPGVFDRNRELALAAQDLLCRSLGQPKPAPNAMMGALASVPLPAHFDDVDALQARLRAANFEVLVLPWPRAPRLVLRVSAQLYNELAQFERLAQVLASN